MLLCRCFRFRFVGSPVRFRGLGTDISASYVLTQTVGGEPMKIHCLPGYISALYLVEYPERDSVILLDCGCPSDYDRIRFYVEEVMNSNKSSKKRLEERLKLVVSTHSHLDHAGASTGYEKSGIPIAYASGMEESYKGIIGRIEQLIEIRLVEFVAGRMGRKSAENSYMFSKGLLGPYWQMPTGSLKLNHGTPLPLGFNDWISIKSPGHTANMITLYHPHTQFFYSADMFVKIKKGFFPPKPVLYQNTYVKSLNNLQDLPARCALLAHGGIIDVNKHCTSWKALIEEVTEKSKVVKPNDGIKGMLLWLKGLRKSLIKIGGYEKGIISYEPITFKCKNEEPPVFQIINS